MARGPVYEDNYKVFWLPPDGVAAEDLSEVTLAEIEAGIYLGRTILKTGVALGVTQNRVDTAGIDDLFDTQRMGSWGMAPVLTCFRDDEDESDGYDTVENGQLGILAIVPFGDPEPGDPAMIIPAEMGEALPADSAANTPQTYQVNFAVHETPNLHATVAGS